MSVTQSPQGAGPAPPGPNRQVWGGSRDVPLAGTTLRDPLYQTKPAQGRVGGCGEQEGRTSRGRSARMGAGEREEPPRLVLPGPWGPVPASSTRKPLSPASCAHSPGQAPRPRGLALGGCLCSSTRPAFVYAGSLPPHSSGLAPQLPLQADSPKLRKVGTRNVLLAREWQRLAERQSRASFPNLSCLTLLAANSETQPGPKSLGVCAKPTVPLGPAQTSPSLRPSAPLPAPTAPGQPGLPAPSP